MAGATTEMGTTEVASLLSQVVYEARRVISKTLQSLQVIGHRQSTHRHTFLQAHTTGHFTMVKSE